MGQILSLFQGASGSWHIPSILMASSWLIGSVVAGGFMLASLRVNRDDRIKAFQKEQLANQQNQAKAQQIEQLESSNAHLQETVTTLRDYAEIAKLNSIGLRGDGLDILFSSPVSTLLADTYTVSNGQSSFNFTPEMEPKYQAVCEKFPDFPFTHYLYAVCLRGHNDAQWRAEAERARQILEKTTAIPAHNPAHDQALVKVEEMLHDG